MGDKNMKTRSPFFCHPFFCRLPRDLTRRTFLQRSAGILAASAGLLELAKGEAETLCGVKTPELRSRAEVEAILGKAPKPAAEANLRPLTIADECFWNLQGDRSKVTGGIPLKD
jgi:hypothetical protein